MRTFLFLGGSILGLTAPAYAQDASDADAGADEMVLASDAFEIDEDAITITVTGNPSEVEDTGLGIEGVVDVEVTLIVKEEFISTLPQAYEFAGHELYREACAKCRVDLQAFCGYLVNDWFDLATHDLYRLVYTNALQAASALGKALNEYCGQPLSKNEAGPFEGCLLSWRRHVDLESLLVANGPDEVDRIVVLALELDDAVSALNRRILPPKN